MNYFEYIQKRKFQLIILFVVLCFSVYKTINKSDKKELYKSQDNYVIGEIINHKVTGLSETYYVTFKYSVSGKNYTKSTNYSKKFVDCYKTRDCIGKKFKVYYNNNDPDEAYIDFE